MANTQSSKKPASKKKTTAKTQPKNVKNKNQSYVSDGIYAIILFCLAVFIVISLITDLTGPVGGGIKNFLLGLIGPAAYILPIFFIYMGVLLIATNKKVASRGICGSVFLLIFAAFWDICVHTAPLMENTPFPDYFSKLISDLYTLGKEVKTGGLFGGLVGVSLSALIGKVGTGILLFAVMLITFVIATGIDLRELFLRIYKKDDGDDEDLGLSGERARTDKQLEKLEKEKDSMGIRAAKYEKDIESRKNPLKEEPTAAEKKKREKFAGLFGKPHISEDDENMEKLFDDIESKYSDEDDEIIPGYEDEEKEKIDAEKETEAVRKEIEAAAENENIKPYKFPPINFLKMKGKTDSRASYDELQQNADKLIETLRSFNIEARIINISRGPTVTRYELQPSTGVRVSKITNLTDDIALQLAATGVRIEAPIPGKSAIGIEVPNKVNNTVFLREIIESREFQESESKLTVSLGKDISGERIIADIAKMPHLMIAGTTGSGKSVCVNSMLMSILYHAKPDEVKLILIDPKVVELNVYNGLPHLLIPVVTDAKKAAGALGWAVSEMMKRYEMFKEKEVRDFNGYNKALSDDEKPLPQIVIIIDEMADLMMTAPHEVEDAVCRLAQMARAAGMHLIVATQRPSADIITGTIKANVPSRIAFSVSSAINSRIILDEAGAEKLVGKGDMLYMPIGAQKATRIQGCFVSDGEVEKVVKFIKENSDGPSYDDTIESQIRENAENLDKPKRSAMQDEANEDSSDEAILRRALEVVVSEGRASTSVLQRRLSLGYARAARIMDEMYERGYIGPYQGSKPREVLISKDQYLEMINRGE